MLKDDTDERQTRNRVPVEEIIDAKFKVIEKYITKFWKEIKERINYTDLSPGPTSFSEAPAESVFSVWGRITSGRESLTIGRTVELIRVAMEGPKASTLESFNLSKRALEKWPSSLGERFTTRKWRPGVISKSVARIQNI